MLETGTVIDGTYKILNQAGQGGMSTVYLAINERANKPWAVKEVCRDGVKNYEMVRRGLLAETNLLKKLRHESIPSIVDVIDRDDSLLIVMDYVEGKSLERILEEEGVQPVEKVAGWGIQLCSVLSYLHAQEPPVLYLDMKPSNVMLRPDGKIILIDFGAAIELRAGDMVRPALGTRGYAAPEQYGCGGQPDARTDIYGLGATLYHLVTGHRPELPDIASGWDGSLSSGLWEILEKCMREEPGERFWSCTELRYALEHYRELEDSGRQMRRRKWQGFLAAALLTMASAAGAAGFHLAEVCARGNSYERCLADAAAAAEMTDKTALYEKAIMLEPSRGEAYEGLLEDALLGNGREGDRLDDREEQELRRVLGAAPGSSVKNEEYLAENTAAYEVFAFRAAVAYYYYSENEGNRQAAGKWWHIVAEAVTLDQQKKERGKRLAKICDYYARIGVANEAGDAAVSYLDYWQDLKDLTAGNLTELDVPKTALVMYQELVSQIAGNGRRFLEAGVSRQDMEEQLEQISGRLRTDFHFEEDANRAMLEETLQRLKEEIGYARGILASLR